MQPRAHASVLTPAQWAAARFDGTRLEAGTVVLERDEALPDALPVGPPGPPAGLAFDARCRLYRADPVEGWVRRWRWDAERQRTGSDGEGVAVLEAPVDPAGDFAPAGGTPTLRPTAVAVDGGDRLFVADAARSRVVVHDLREGGLLRTRALPTPPLDLAAGCRRVLALLENRRVVVLEAHRDLGELALPPALDEATRIAVAPDGSLALLERGGTATAELWWLAPLEETAGGLRAERVWHELGIPRATDVAFDADGLLVVARHPGEPMVRFSHTAWGLEEHRPLRGTGYDGRGIVRTPHGRIAYWTARGLRNALRASPRYVTSGTVRTAPLDGRTFGRRWGRIFVDACVPRGAVMRIRCAVADRVEDLALPSPDEAGHLHARPGGREIPWLPAAEDGTTFEAPAPTERGRWLLVALDLAGDSTGTPRVEAVRAEYPVHPHLERLPRLYARDPDQESFLVRYLALLDSPLFDLDARAAHRDVLLRPGGAPAEMLPWLAGFVGLVLDRRWPESTQRRTIAEAAELFRTRGTVASLVRFITLYLDGVHDIPPGGGSIPVRVIEHFKLRGLGGSVVGDTGSAFSGSVLGGGFRVGGAVGSEEVTPAQEDTDAAFRRHAHRFSVIIAASLTPEQRDVVRQILEVHRPAHTLFDVCAVDAGMRVGRGLHVGLSSIVGGTNAFRTLRLGSGLLGRDGVLGWPHPVTRAAGVRLGSGTRLS